MNIFPFYAWKQGAEEHFERKAAAMDQIFNVITLVSMGLCFFSLSSTMTANIYDQTNEISVMRAFGCTKYFLLKIFIYESLILVISSSLIGFFIGIITGNLMIL